MSKKLIALASPLASLVFPLSAFAADINIEEPASGVKNISKLINSGFQLAILVAIIFVFAMLILGGYGWITAGGDKAKVEEARNRITNAIMGLAILASAFAIYKLVDKFFGIGLVSPDKTPSTTQNRSPGLSDTPPSGSNKSTSPNQPTTTLQGSDFETTKTSPDPKPK